MEAYPISAWKVLSFRGSPIRRSLVNLRLCLFNGQAFSWFKTDEPEAYWGVCKGNYFEFRYNTLHQIEYRSTLRLYRDTQSPEDSIIDYFGLSIDYNEVFKDLIKDNVYFEKAFEKADGLRVLRQDPWECMIGFICSQNNNIRRIAQMVQSLCGSLGDVLMVNERGEFRSFPAVERVAAANVEDLNRLGFGYRSKYMIKSSQQLLEKGGVKYLFGLRETPTPKVLNEKMQEFTGVGAKVADCISLFSLDCYSLVPIDTHMFQICEKLYKKKFSKYDDAREFLHDKLGKKYAGIAHTFLFTFELNDFKDKNKKGGESKESDIKVGDNQTEETKPKRGVSKVNKKDEIKEKNRVKSLEKLGNKEIGNSIEIELVKPNLRKPKK